MRRFATNFLFFLLLPPFNVAQEVKPLPSADERFKADILLVVAHPDDEGGVTPYLARAIYDEHKRVAVVYTTRGGSGGDDYNPGRRAGLGGILLKDEGPACAPTGNTDQRCLDGEDEAYHEARDSI